MMRDGESSWLLHGLFGIYGRRGFIALWAVVDIWIYEGGKFVAHLGMRHEWASGQSLLTGTDFGVSRMTIRAAQIQKQQRGTTVYKCIFSIHPSGQNPCGVASVS